MSDSNNFQEIEETGTQPPQPLEEKKHATTIPTNEMHLVEAFVKYHRYLDRLETLEKNYINLGAQLNELKRQSKGFNLFRDLVAKASEVTVLISYLVALVAAAWTIFSYLDGKISKVDEKVTNILIQISNVQLKPSETPNNIKSPN